MGSYIALCFGSSAKLVPCPEGCLGLTPLVPPAFECVSFHTDVLTLPKVEPGKEAGKGKESPAERFPDAQEEVSVLLVLALEKLAVLSPTLKNITKSCSSSL